MTSNVSRDEWEQLVNDVRHVKASTQSINRIMVLSNDQVIRGDLLIAVGDSEIRAAALECTAEPTTAKDLAARLGIDPRNLTALLRPLLDKSYIVVERKNGHVLYKREEKADLIGCTRIPEIKSLLERWRARRFQTGQ